jgi:hypothetical protein
MGACGWHVGENREIFSRFIVLSNILSLCGGVFSFSLPPAGRDRYWGCAPPEKVVAKME